MKLTLSPIRRLSTLCLVAGVLTSCTAAGDFCDVVRAPLTFEPETAAAIGRTDIDTARRIVLQNSYGAANCPAVGWQAGNPSP